MRTRDSLRRRIGAVVAFAALAALTLGVPAAGAQTPAPAAPPPAEPEKAAPAAPEARAEPETKQQTRKARPRKRRAVSVRLSNERTLSRWAHPARTSFIYSAHRAKSRRVGRLQLFTEDGFAEVYLLLSRWTSAKGADWVKIRIPKRPNGAVGWVPRDALGAFRVVRTQLLVNRTTLRATLYKSGKRVWTARVGVGKPGTPTPAGRFWIREKFRFKNAPFYGTHAFGTSAYAPTLSDWPGGGVVGLHGTSQPGLIPGRPSHGCVRIKNPDIARLYRLMPVGTPLHIK